mmetsp:Transcript_22806/g.73551  ORF Transcript_22806/g.73551 Transcript_22806/m.73551 type:complete len:276 (-) Transcript_22806:219-1046(-)
MSSRKDSAGPHRTVSLRRGSSPNGESISTSSALGEHSRSRAMSSCLSTVSSSASTAARMPRPLNFASAIWIWLERFTSSNAGCCSFLTALPPAPPPAGAAVGFCPPAAFTVNSSRSAASSMGGAFGSDAHSVPFPDGCTFFQCSARSCGPAGRAGPPPGGGGGGGGGPDDAQGLERGRRGCHHPGTARLRLQPPVQHVGRVGADQLFGGRVDPLDCRQGERLPRLRLSHLCQRRGRHRGGELERQRGGRQTHHSRARPRHGAARAELRVRAQPAR